MDGGLPAARRSFDVDGLGSGSTNSGGSTSPSGGSGSNGTPASASSSLAASMLLLRPRAFARQLSDDLRRRRESYAAGQFSTSSSGSSTLGTGSGGGCYSPLAGPGSSRLHHHHHHRHSVGGFQLGAAGSLQPHSYPQPVMQLQQQRLHSVAVAAASYATGTDLVSCSRVTWVDQCECKVVLVN